MQNNAGKEEFEIGKKARLRGYDKLFSYLSKLNQKVLILGLNPIFIKKDAKKNVIQRAGHIEKHNKGLKKLCQEFRFPFLDPRNIFKNVKLNEYYVDTIHPNSKGYDLMFKSIYKKLVELKYL